MMWNLAYFDNKCPTFVLPAAIFLIVLVGLVDYLTGTELSFSIFYLIPVSIVAWYRSNLNAVLASIISAIIWFAIDLLGGHIYSTPFIPYWNASVRLGFFLIIAYLLKSWKNSLAQELELAQEIQQGLLPKTIPQLKGYEISCISKPARAISGDYFDVIKFSDTELGICIADVAGHRFPAAILMSNLQGAFKILSATAIQPNDLCNKLDAVIGSNMTSGKFITFFYALLDSTKKMLVYTNAGHHRPLLARKDGSLIELDKGGFALGLKQDAVYESTQVPLSTGDRLLFFTDGIVEARNSKKEEFGVKRLISVLQKKHHFGATEIRDLVIESASKFCKSNFPDDVTVIVISVP